jgi:hypothetical protein
VGVRKLGVSLSSSLDSENSALPTGAPGSEPLTVVSPRPDLTALWYAERMERCQEQRRSDGEIGDLNRSRS